MTRIDHNLTPVRTVKRPLQLSSEGLKIEIFVTTGFCALETGSISHTLQQANSILQRNVFRVTNVASTSGIVAGQSDFLLRTAAAEKRAALPDMLFIVGGDKPDPQAWLPRLRLMQRQSRCVVLLSDAATAYIRASKDLRGEVTTHWRDAETLRETGYYPNLTDHLAEQADGVVTAAGKGSTAELVIGLISPFMAQTQVAELGNLLLLPTIRKSDADQPKDMGGNATLFDRRVTDVIRMMEAHISDPLDIPTLTQKVGLSSRQVERVFREVFDQSPGRFYKQLRTKKARALIEETLLPLAEIAVATGFGSVSTMSKSVQALYGVTPAQSRARKSVSLTHFAPAE